MKPLWQLVACVCLTGFFCAAADTCSAYGAWIGDGETGWTYVENGEEKRDSWHWDGSWWYYLAQDGKMETGWLLKDGIWYYLCPEVGMPQGSAASGWKWIDEKWYWFHQDHDGHFGEMETNRWVDGYFLGSDGAWTGEMMEEGEGKAGPGTGLMDEMRPPSGGSSSGGSSSGSGSSGGSSSSGNGALSGGVSSPETNPSPDHTPPVADGSENDGVSGQEPVSYHVIFAESGNNTSLLLETVRGETDLGREVLIDFPEVVYRSDGTVWRTEEKSPLRICPEEYGIHKYYVIYTDVTEIPEDPEQEKRERLAAWEEKAREAERMYLGEDGAMGRDWLVFNQEETNRRIRDMVSRLKAGTWWEWYFISVDFTPNTLMFANFPEVSYSVRTEDRFELEGRTYVVTVLRACLKETSQNQPQESGRWELGMVTERELGGQNYQFRCIDEEFSSGGKPFALFLCEEIIPSSIESNELEFRKLPFGTDNNYKTSRVRKWLQKQNMEGLEPVSTGVDTACTGSTEPGRYMEFDSGALQFEEIGTQKLTDGYFLLSVEEAIRYRDALWKFDGIEQPETQVGPYSRGYWLRTPVYEEREGEFVYGENVYVVDLEQGCIRPEWVGSGEMGIRPAYAVQQSETGRGDIS